MSNWDQAIKLLLKAEGGYVNDPYDPGGETNFGISKRSYPNEDIAAMTPERASELYKRDYWTPIQGDKLPDKMAVVLLDSAVNQGVMTAITLLQVSLKLHVDGIMGPKTLSAIERSGDLGVWLFLLHRAQRYMRTRNVERYGFNWGTRLCDLAEALFLDPDKLAWVEPDITKPT